MSATALLFARTVGFGEAVVIAVIVVLVVVGSLIALRNRPGGDA